MTSKNRIKTNKLYLTGCLKNVDAPYCPRNEYEVKRFIEKIESFTEGKIMLIVLWSTRNIKSLFSLKNKVGHQSCVIYKGNFFCKLSSTGETKRNSEVRWKEHEDPAGKSNPQST